MNNTLMVMQTSWKTSDDSDVLKSRETWICNGLRSLTHINDIMKEFDCVYIDNTVNDESELPKEIVDLIPENCERIYDTNLNHYGKRNSGAANIEMISSIEGGLHHYDWYIHHEPRTVLRHGRMFEEFIENPTNYFRVGSPTNKDECSFWTGTYFIHTKDLLQYLESVDLEVMCQDSISVEYDLYKFIDSNNIEYRTTDDAGVLWNDKQEGTNYHV